MSRAFETECVHVGIEAASDLLADLTQALA